MGMDALLECGLPAHVNFMSRPQLVGGRTEGFDISAHDYWGDRFIMSLVWFNANEPVHGLMMYDAGPSSRIGNGLIPPPEKHRWFFFGYKCERCQKTFLVPSTLKSSDYLSNVLHHSCHSDGSPDYVQVWLKDRARQATVCAIDRLISNNAIKPTDGAHTGAILVQQFEELAATIWQEMKNFNEEQARR